MLGSDLLAHLAPALPALESLAVVVVAGQQRRRPAARERRPAVAERLGDGGAQGVAVEREAAREAGHVPEVLHARVPVALAGHRVKLLGDHRLTRVRSEAGSGEVEQRGVVLLPAAEGDDVAEADVDRDREPDRSTSSETERR